MVLRDGQDQRITRLSDSDWVALRLLFLVMATDPSNVSIEDVQKSLDYFGYKTMLFAFDLLVKEHRKTGMFEGNADSALLRKFRDSVELNKPQEAL